MPIDQIFDLDPWLVPNVYFHPRDKDGELMLSPKPGAKKTRSPRDVWIEEHKKLDIPAWWVLDEWDKIQEQIRIGTEMMEKLRSQTKDPAKISPEAMASFLNQRPQPVRERQEDKQ